MAKVSVLMAVYNCEAFVADAIESVLKQSFTDFEFLIMDDGSTDKTVEIIKRYKDRRIRLEQKNHDFIGNLNEGLRIAQGKYIARMDADDIMHSERLSIQVQLMEERTNIAVCGSWVKSFGKGIIPNLYRHGNGEISQPLLKMVKGNIMLNPTTMLRKSFITRHGILYRQYTCAEDYRFFFDIAKANGCFYIEPQVLLFYRINTSQQTQMRKDEMATTDRKIREEIVECLLTNCEYLHHEFSELYHNLLDMEKRGILSKDTLWNVLYEAFENRSKVVL